MVRRKRERLPVPFSPLENPADAFELLEILKIDTQWATMKGKLNVRCRVHEHPWSSNWERVWNYKLAIVRCAAFWQAGKEEYV